MVDRLPATALPVPSNSAAGITPAKSKRRLLRGAWEEVPMAAGAYRAAIAPSTPV
jgi:hypothetical protein